MAQELNRRLCSQAVDTLPDALGSYPELEEFDLYAGDGHWHGAAAHDARIDETKWAVGHFYALDLRRHTLRHLGVGLGKKEQDMHVLKRLDADVLRQHAPKGRKVLYVWDKAGIDFHAWHRWKQSSGLYFLSLEKETMKLRIQGLPKWDRTDPVNAGIQSVELVAGLAGVMIRRIHYVEPVEGTEYHFITSELNLRPGLVAFLYKLRWDVEKVFDVLKNKFQRKASLGQHRHRQVGPGPTDLLGSQPHPVLGGKASPGGDRKPSRDPPTPESSGPDAGGGCGGKPKHSSVCSCPPAPHPVLRKTTPLLRSALRDRLAWEAATPRLRTLYATF